MSLRPGCDREKLLLLWQHECDWVYGKRMVNEVDTDRYKHAFKTAVRKQFNNEEHVSY